MVVVASRLKQRVPLGAEFCVQVRPTQRPTATFCVPTCETCQSGGRGGGGGGGSRIVIVALVTGFAAAAALSRELEEGLVNLRRISRTCVIVSASATDQTDTFGGLWAVTVFGFWMDEAFCGRCQMWNVARNL